MTQEEKDLLLKDLCSRLPYGVKVNITSKESTNRIVHLTADNICNLTSGWWSECKPYLFPLSSMTEEQKKEIKEISKCEYAIRNYGGFHSEGVYLIEIGKYEYEYDIDTTVEEFYLNHEIIDWFNKNHFDYRCLIEKGLAIEVNKSNNPYKE